MSEKNLQKNASGEESVRKRRVLEGVLRPTQFAQHIRAERYEPSPTLEPFVTHYFIARWDFQGQGVQVVSEVLSEPVIYLLFKLGESSVVGITTDKRNLQLKGKGTYAVVRFKPGGFYAFWKRSLAELTGKTLPITESFPTADNTFVKTLLAGDDRTIIRHIEALLLTAKPVASSKVELVNEIAKKIEADPHFHTAQEVARQCNMSERTLQHMFKTYIGVSAKWVIMRARFLDALRHAHQTEKPNWTKIAAELGYSTQSHFINEFKRIMGQSPAQYVKAASQARKVSSVR